MKSSRQIYKLNIQKVVEDVENLQTSNQEKDIDIVNISIGNSNLEVKLATMKNEKKE